MEQFYIQGEMDTEKLGKILNLFQTRDLPKLVRYYNYYKGKQAILSKQPTDTGKPCNKIVVNYCYNITENFQGYLAGKPIAYEGEKLDEILEILNYNDVTTEDAELLRQALIFGRAFEINFFDENGKQRFKCLDSRQCIPVYENTLTGDLKYVIRFYKEETAENISSPKHIVEVYDSRMVRKYRSEMGFQSFEFLEERPHNFAQAPVTVFSLNAEEDSCFGQIMTLQDSYNQLISDEVDDFDAFADAYMILKGVIADEEDLEAMKEHRVLMMDADASAEYLTKSISDTQIKDMLDNINQQIHKISNSPDLNDEKFMSQSGIAIQYKLVGFENEASAIEKQMRKALQRRIELICGALALVSEDTWRDVDIIFTRNLPMNVSEIVQMVNQLRGIVSQRTILSLLPFVKDVEQELKEVREEKEDAMLMYSFGAPEIATETGEE